MKKIIALIFIVLLLSACGKSVDVDGAKVSYDELQDKIDEKEKELKEIESHLEENEEKYNELQELANDEDDLVDRLINYKVEISELKDSIEEKEEKVDKLDDKIVKYEDKPIKINPGVYYFGEDIDEGRYKVTYQEGQHGNIYFHGDESFAQTFGDDETKEYTFYASDGEDLKADIAILLYPVEE